MDFADAVGLLLLGLVLGLVLRTPRPAALLPDGTLLQITGVKVGYTNEFAHRQPIGKDPGGLDSDERVGGGRWEEGSCSGPIW